MYSVFSFFLNRVHSTIIGRFCFSSLPPSPHASISSSLHLLIPPSPHPSISSSLHLGIPPSSHPSSSSSATPPDSSLLPLLQQQPLPQQAAPVLPGSSVPPVAPGPGPPEEAPAGRSLPTACVRPSHPLRSFTSPLLPPPMSSIDPKVYTAMMAPPRESTPMLLLLLLLLL